MKRRDSLAALALIAICTHPMSACTQQSSPPAAATVAILDDAPEATRADLWALFKRRLAELGYVEAKNLTIRQRFADGDAKRLQALAAELVSWKPDLIVAVTTTAARRTRPPAFRSLRSDPPIPSRRGSLQASRDPEAT